MKDFKIVVRYGDSSPNISRYYSEVNKHKMLDAEEEARLAILAKNGDQKAKDAVINSNLRFAISVAKSYINPNCSFEDLISEANKGLVEAIENYDPSTGFKFISYAVWHIRKNIMLYISNLSQTVRIPTNIQVSIRNYQKIVDAFIQKNGREPNIEEASEIMADSGMQPLSKSTIDTIKNKPSSVPLDPMNIFGSEEEGKGSPINYLSSDEKTDSLIDDSDKKDVIKKLISSLKPVEQRVIELKYGLLDENPLSYKEISEKFDRTPEWARQISLKAEKRMKIEARKNKIKNWL